MNEMDIIPGRRTKHLTTDQRLDQMDGRYRQDANALYEKFRQAKIESTKDILGLTGEVLASLWKDIIDSKKADSLFKGLNLAASLQKEFLNVDFPEEIVKQANKTIAEFKVAAVQAHKELLCPTCYQKVSEKLGWE